MKYLRQWLIFWLAVGCSFSVMAEAVEDEIQGFTIDNTITRIGHDFARYLGDYRNSNLSDSDYNLAVYERPSARWGSLIWITKDHRILYRQFIQPSNNRLKEIAEQVARQVHDQVTQQKLQELFSDTFDIDKDEI